MSYMYIEKISSEIVYRKSSKICRFLEDFSIYRKIYSGFGFTHSVLNLEYTIFCS